MDKIVRELLKTFLTAIHESDFPRRFPRGPVFAFELAWRIPNDVENNTAIVRWASVDHGGPR